MDHVRFQPRTKMHIRSSFIIGGDCDPYPPQCISQEVECQKTWPMGGHWIEAVMRFLQITLALIASGSGAGKGAAFAKYHHTLFARDVAFH